MRITQTLLIASLFLIPMGAFAAPAPITGVQAELREGGVFVSWDANPDAVQYALYLSHESILETAGLYDEVLATPNTETSIFLPTEVMPLTENLHIAVTAIDASNTSSTLIIEESVVDVRELFSIPEKRSEAVETDTPVDTTSTVEQPAMTGSNGTVTNLPLYGDPALFELYAVEYISPVEVRLTFSDPVHILPAQARTAFTITSEDSKLIYIEKISIENNIVSLRTDPLTPGMLYIVTLGAGIRSPREGTLLTLTMPTGPVSFRTPGGSSPFIPTKQEGSMEPEDTMHEDPQTPPSDAPKEEVNSPESANTPLSESGIGILSTILVTGSMTGFAYNRRKRSSLQKN